jgi:hypothetical protein
MPELKSNLYQITNILCKGMNEEEIASASRLLEIMINNAVEEVNQLK